MVERHGEEHQADEHEDDEHELHGVALADQPALNLEGHQHDVMEDGEAHDGDAPEPLDRGAVEQHDAGEEDHQDGGGGEGLAELESEPRVEHSRREDAQGHQVGDPGAGPGPGGAPGCGPGEAADAPPPGLPSAAARPARPPPSQAGALGGAPRGEAEEAADGAGPAVDLGGVHGGELEEHCEKGA